MTGQTPPRYVPTLTDRYHPAADAAPAPDAVPSPASAEILPEHAQEQLVRRIMQRVDSTLERRLREAIATTVLEQTRGLEPLVRAAIEGALHQAVLQAVVDERAEGFSVQPPAC